MEEFDAAWGEVEKGLRDSFRAGREKKRGQRLENTASNAQRQIEMIRQRQNQAPKAATGKRTAPRRTVSSPPTPTPTPTPTSTRPAPPSGGPKRETVSAPPAPKPKTERQMWGRPEGEEGIDVEASMEELTPNPQPAGSGEIAEGQTLDDFFSAGRQPKQEASKLEPVIAAKVQPKTPERDLGKRKGKAYTGYNRAKNAYQAAIDSGDITPEQATAGFMQHSDMMTGRGEFEQKPSLEESKARLSGGEQAIPVPQNTGSPTSQQPVQQIPAADPIDTATGNIEAMAGNAPANEEEANAGGWKAVEEEIAPPAPAPPAPAPPAPEPAPIATPASQEPTISNTVNDEPGEPEPPASVADTPVEVETEQPTSVADTPVVEAPKPNPTEGLPKASPEAKKTAASIKPSEAVAQAATKNIASEGVSYGDYSKHIQGAMQGNEASLDFLRNNPDAVKRHSPSGLPQRIQDSIGGEAPAKKAPAKKTPAKAKPKPKKTTAKDIVTGKKKQPNSPKKKSEPVKNDGDFGTFAGEKPVIKALDWHDLGFLRPYSEDTTFYTDRKGRPAIASGKDPRNISVAHARPSNMSVEQLNRIIEGIHPLSYTNSRLFNTAGKPIMRNLPSAGAMLTGGGGENKDPRNNWVVDGKIQLPNMKKPASDDNAPGSVDLKTLLANNPSLKSSKRKPFGNPRTKNYGIGLPVHYQGSKGPSIGHTLDYGSGRGVYEARLNMGSEAPAMANIPESTLSDQIHPWNHRDPVEMSIGELMQRLKPATSKDAEEYVNMNESAYSKDQLKYLHSGLNTQSDKDETVSIYAGNDYPLEARLLGGEYENDAGEHIRNLLSQFIAPRTPSDIEGQNNILE